MDRLNKGSLYETEQKILRQGSINVNGGDESFIITERVGKDCLLYTSPSPRD